MIKELHKVEGFTLIELMVTIAVAAILLAVATPSFQRVAQNNAVRSTSNDLVATFNLARQHSMSLRQKIEVKPNSGGWAQGWTVDLKDGSPEAAYRPRTGVLVERTKGVGAVVFHEQGVERSEFIVKHENTAVASRKICLNILGSVRRGEDCK